MASQQPQLMCQRCMELIMTIFVTFEINLILITVSKIIY